MKRILAVILLVAIVLVAFAACSDSSNKDKAGQFSGSTINIVYQNGMSYAPFYIMQEKKLIEKYLPGVTVNWTVAASGQLVSEALSADRADVGVMGVAPLLIAWDKGANIKMLSSLVNSPLDLVVMNDKYKSLKDFKPTDKIAVPAPGSIQDILLSMAAEKELGNANALKDNVLGVAHPQAMTQLLSGAGLAGHFSSSPFLFQEVAQGGKVIVEGFNAFGGDFTFLGAVATKKFVEGSPLYAAAVYMALSDAMQLVNSRDSSAIDIIAAKEKITTDQVKQYLDWAGTNYTTTPYGVMGLADFMKKTGKISKAPANLSDFCWNTVTSIVGKRSGSPSVLEQAQTRK